MAKLLNQWLRERLSGLDDPAFENPLQDWHWTSCTVNRGYAARRHVDRNNFGPSIARSFGSSRNDGLYYWHDQTARRDRRGAVLLDIRSRDRLVMFDGTRPHETKRNAGNMDDRYSIIFFMAKKGWEAPAEVHQMLALLGFNVPATASAARLFEARYNTLCDGTTWYRVALPIKTREAETNYNDMD